MLTRKQKEDTVKELQQELESSKTALLCDYKGIDVAGMKKLRSSLREVGAKMRITKKTLIDIAFKNAKIGMEVKGMEGQIGLVTGGSDEVASPKALHAFAKKEEKLKILAGVLEGQAINREEVINLALLPSREELLARMVGSIGAPLSGFVRVLGGNLRKLVYVLNAIKEAKN